MKPTPGRPQNGRGLGVHLLAWLALPACALADTSGGRGFLSLKQRCELVLHGGVSDAAGDRHNVRLCPGYARPTHRAAEHFGASERAFAEYGQRETYRRMAELSGRAYRWGFGSCLRSFALSGTGQAWARRLAAAGDRARHDLLGRALRYPWAAVQATGESIVRVPAGLGGALVGAGAGTLAIPGYSLSRPGGRGLYEAAVHGVAAPACGYVWNTLVSLPLALVGRAPKAIRKPAAGPRPSAAQTGGGDTEEAPALGDMELENLATWALSLLKELQPYSDQREKVDRDRDDRVREIHQKAEAQTKELYRKERDHYDDLLRSSRYRELLRRLGQGEFSPRRLAQQEEELDRILRHRGLNRAERQDAIRLLHRYPMQLRIDESPERTRGGRP